MKISEMRLQRKNGPPITLHTGRHYPRYIAAGTADIFAGNTRTMRILEMDAATVTIDLNQQLARMPLDIGARIHRCNSIASEHGGGCKAIELWTELHPFERVGLVLE